MVTFKGKQFANVKEMCNFYGIDTREYMSRVCRGWTWEKALTTPVRKGNLEVGGYIGPNGKHFDTFSEFARYYGVKPTSKKRRNAKATTKKAQNSFAKIVADIIHKAKRGMVVGAK